MIVVVRWFRTILWRQVNLPLLRETEQKFKMCSKVPWFEHRGHLDTILFPHLLRLSGVGKVLVVLFRANDRTPLGTLLMIDFQVIFSFSSINNFAKSPCIVRSSTLLFQTSNVCSWVDCLIAFFALGNSERIDEATSKVFCVDGINTVSFWILSSRICWQETIVDDLFVQLLSLSSSWCNYQRDLPNIIGMEF